MMKTHTKQLFLKKVKIAKVDAFHIKGGNETLIPSVNDCYFSRTPKEGRTQTESYDGNCEDTES